MRILSRVRRAIGVMVSSDDDTRDIDDDRNTVKRREIALERAQLRHMSEMLEAKQRQLKILHMEQKLAMADDTIAMMSGQDDDTDDGDSAPDDPLSAIAAGVASHIMSVGATHQNYPKNQKVASGPSAGNQFSSEPLQVELSDSEIADRMRSIPSHVLAQFRALSPDDRRRTLHAEFPSLSPLTVEKIASRVI